MLQSTNKDTNVYTIHTSHGSIFTIVFKSTTSIEDSLEDFGDMLLQGYSNLVKGNISFAGLGFRPEVGGRLAVRRYPDDDIFDPAEYTELITEVEEVVYE